MNSRDRVRQAMLHQEPDRVPCWCGASQEFWAKMKRTLDLDDEPLREFLGDDFRRVFSQFEPSSEVVDLARSLAGDAEITSITPLGVPRTGLGYGQPIAHPFACATRDQIESYPWPTGADVRIDNILDDARSYGGKYAILGGEWSPYWHDLIDLFGIETLFYKMYDEPELVDLVCERVVDFYHEATRRTFDAAGELIDIFFIGNDFGSQRGPLVDEATFRRFLLPQLERLIRLGHDYDLPVMLHCCGGIAELLPSLIEAGLDAIHALQPCCDSMSPVRLKSEFGDRIVLNGGIDSHHVLIEGTTDDVRRATREVLDVMMPGGGFIAGASHDTILEETPVENVVAMFETIREYGVYGSMRDSG